MKVLSELGIVLHVFSGLWTCSSHWSFRACNLGDFTSSSCTAWVTFSITALLYLCSFRFAGLTKGVEGRLGEASRAEPSVPRGPRSIWDWLLTRSLPEDTGMGT